MQATTPHMQQYVQLAFQLVTWQCHRKAEDSMKAWDDKAHSRLRSL